MKDRLLLNPENSNTAESGQSFVELAISIVFILILLAAVVDLGRAFFVFVALRDAAQEGASYGSICPEDEDGIHVRARSTSSRPVDLLDTTGITVEVFRDYLEDEITVRVSSSNFKLTMPFLGGVTLPLSAQVTDTILTFSLHCPP